MSREFILYRWWDAEGRLLYVGKSVSVLARIARHRKESPFFQDAVSMTMQRFPDAESLAKAEVEAIHNEGPLHNVRHAQVRTPPGVYTFEEFAWATSISKEMVRRVVARGELATEMYGRKRVITREEGLRWLHSLPERPPQKAA